MALFLYLGTWLISYKLSVGLDYTTFILETVSEISGIVLVWYHFETRLLSIFDPSLENIHDQMVAFRDQLTQLFYQILDLSGSLFHYYVDKGAAGQAGTLSQC